MCTFSSGNSITPRYTLVEFNTQSREIVDQENPSEILTHKTYPGLRASRKLGKKF